MKPEERAVVHTGFDSAAHGLLNQIASAITEDLMRRVPALNLALTDRQTAHNGNGTVIRASLVGLSAGNVITDEMAQAITERLNELRNPTHLTNMLK